MRPLVYMILALSLFLAVVSIASALNPLAGAKARVEKRICVMDGVEFYEVDGRAYWRVFE